MSSSGNGAWSNLCSAQNLLCLFWYAGIERSYCCHLVQNQSNLCATPEGTAPWDACGVCWQPDTLTWNTLHSPPQKQQSHTSCSECLQQRAKSSSPGSKQRGNSILSLWQKWRWENHRLRTKGPPAREHSIGLQSFTFKSREPIGCGACGDSHFRLCSFYAVFSLEAVAKK